MRLLRLFGLLAFLLAAHAAFAGTRTPASDEFGELVRNLKEKQSNVGNHDDRELIDAIFPVDGVARARVAEAFAAVVESMKTVEGADHVAACEPRVLGRFAEALRARGIPAEVPVLRAALLVLRESHRIDDLALLPLLAAIPAWIELGFREEDWKGQTDPTAVSACPTTRYMELVANVRKLKGRPFKRKHIDQAVRAMADEGRYRPIEAAWLRELRRIRFDVETPFDLPAILGRVAKVRNSSARANASETPTSLLSKRRPGSGGITNRVALYRDYDPLQIERLVETFKRYMEHMDITASEASIVFKYKDGRPDEVLPLDSADQERLAARILNKEVHALRNAPMMAGKAPTFDDVIVACVETGFVRSEEVERVLKTDDLWNPRLTGWQKVLNIAKRYGSVGLVLIPNPYTFWVSLAVGLVQTQTGKSEKASARDRGVSIF